MVQRPCNFKLVQNFISNTCIPSALIEVYTSLLFSFKRNARARKVTRAQFPPICMIGLKALQRRVHTIDKEPRLQTQLQNITIPVV